MKYAWANPTTGLREQDDSEQNARLRVWQELQAVDDQTAPYARLVYEQTQAGRVELSGSDGPEIPCPYLRQEFAWCDPTSGERNWSSVWPQEQIQMRLKEQKEAGTLMASEVLVYYQREAFTVRRDDPEPAAPEPTPATPMLASPLANLRADAESVTASSLTSPDLLLAKCTALALLDIAETLRDWKGLIVPPAPMPEVGREFCESVFDPPPDPVCTCTGDGHATDGTFCVCEAGQELKRQASVAGRPIPEPIPGCTACYMHPSDPGTEMGVEDVPYTCKSCGRKCIITGKP